MLLLLGPAWLGWSGSASAVADPGGDVAVAASEPLRPEAATGDAVDPDPGASEPFGFPATAELPPVPIPHVIYLPDFQDLSPGARTVYDLVAPLVAVLEQYETARDLGDFHGLGFTDSDGREMGVSWVVVPPGFDMSRAERGEPRHLVVEEIEVSVMVDQAMVHVAFLVDDVLWQVTVGYPVLEHRVLGEAEARELLDRVLALVPDLAATGAGGKGE
jgi:hypothetical protein